MSDHCETHRKAVTPCCAVCLLNERDRLRAELEDEKRVHRFRKMQVRKLRARVRELEEALPPAGAYSGIKMWVGDKMIQRIVDKTTWEYELIPGDHFIKHAQECIDALANSEKGLGL